MLTHDPTFDSGSMFVGHDAERPWQEVGRDAIVAVIDRVGIKDMVAGTCHRAGCASCLGIVGTCLDVEELSVDGIAQCLTASLVFGLVGFEQFDGEALAIQGQAFGVGATLQLLDEDVVELHHILEEAVEVARADEYAIGHAIGILAMDEFGCLGWTAPVGIFVSLHNTRHRVTMLLPEVHHPATHGGIVATDGLDVAKLRVEHIGAEDEDRRPGDVVVIVVPEGGSHAGQGAVGSLRVFEVLHPFQIERMVVHQVTFAPAAHRMVAHPRLSLVALRTIDGHALVVGANAPERILHHAIEHGIGGLEGVERLHRVAHDFAQEGRSGV